MIGPGDEAGRLALIGSASEEGKRPSDQDPMVFGIPKLHLTLGPKEIPLVFSRFFSVNLVN